MAAVSKKLNDSGGPTDGHGSLSRTSSSRGSFRKLLPSVPDMDQQLTMAAKMIDRRTSTPKGKHSYTPYFLEYNLLAEYNLLQSQNIGGVYVVPSAQSPLVWFGVIFVRQGVYSGGVFRFTLNIPENFPDGDVPSVFLDVPVFHPQVDPETGEVGIKRGFANKWRRNMNHLWHVVLYFRRCFYKIETGATLNPEAAVLFDSDNEMFLMRARACVEASKKDVYSSPKVSDPHAIVFSEYQPAVHEAVRHALKQEKKEKEADGEKGLSWVKPGSLQVLSRQES